MSLLDASLVHMEPLPGGADKRDLKPSRLELMESLVLICYACCVTLPRERARNH
jgi:hypothetical protein